MRKRLSGLSLAFAVMAAVSIAVASPAQASAPEFHCTATSVNCVIGSSGGTNGSGSNDNQFVFGGGVRFKCLGKKGVSDGAQFTTTAPKTTTTLPLTAAYTGCETFGLVVTVDMGGCTYDLSMVPSSNPATATTALVCPAGKKVTIAVPAIQCQTTIENQTNLSHWVFANAEGAEPTHISTTITVEGIIYTTTGPECPQAAGTYKDGKYLGTVTLTGFNDIEGTKGAKVGLHVF